nr:hypothetical protein [Tanacetum cinerariifolium]
MTLELANRAICTPAGIARDVFVPVGKFTFPANFVIVDYENDPRVPLILRRPFLRTARALIDVHGEEMILRDGDERLILNMRHETSSYSNQPQKESINLINVFNNSSEDFLEDLFSNQPSGNPTFSSHPELTSPKVNNDNPLSGSTTFSSNPLLEEFADELAFPPKYDDDLQFDIESDLKKIEFLLYQDVNSKIESDAENVYDDPFGSKGEKTKESKHLIDELDLPCDFLPSEYDSFISQDFSRVDALPSTNNKDKIFNPSILIQEKSFEIITRVVQDKKLATSNASSMLEDFNPPFYEPLFFKEVPSSKMLLPFSSENEEKVFKPGYSWKLKDQYRRILSSKSSFPQLQLGIMNGAHVGYNCPAQQYPCCEDCEVTHEPYQCQPKNHNYYQEQNSCYDSNSFGFDHGQPPQYTINHPIFNAHNAFLDSQNELSITQNKIMEQMKQLTSMCETACQIIQKKQEEKRIEEEQAAKAQNSKIPICYNDDGDYNSAITPNEPVDSLSMGDEHLNTISATKSDEFVKSCVENLVPNPSESEGENGCDVLACFTTFSNVIFEADYKSDSSDYQSCSDEDFPKEIFSNPLFEKEIISIQIYQHHFNAESDLIESLLNRDSSIFSSSLKIDSLLDEFRLLYDNSSPRLPEEFVSENSDADIESFSPSPIPNEDSDSRMEEIDLTFTPDDPMPSSIEDDDNDSERDILIHEELPSNYSLSLPVIESFYFDIPSFSRPPAKPPDGNIGILNIKTMGDVSDQKVPIPEIMITRVLNQEKSPDLFSHQSLENFKLSVKCPMMIHGKNIVILDVPLFYFYPLDQL